MLTITHLATAALLVGFAGQIQAQGAGESLGPKDSGGKATYLLQEMKSLPSALKSELMNVHPRVYFTAAELDGLRTRAHGSQKEWWQQRLTNLRALKEAPPPPPAEKRRAQNDVAFAIAEAAFAYNMERDPKILAAAKLYMDAAVSYKIWGYSWSKPNVDLAAGHLLYGMGLAYDLLYNDLTPAERDRYRSCIAEHAHLLYQYFAPRPGRTWSYSQNHTFIPISGLAVAAYALYGENPEAAQWAALSRAIYDRVLLTYSQDGYYYEGYEYWIFSTPWIIHYLDALKHASGEDLFDHPGLRQTYLYAIHSLTPGGEFPFDFGDVYGGPITRKRVGDDYQRSHPGGQFESNYNLLYDLAARYHSSEIQGAADWMRSLGHVDQEEWWTLAWRDPALAPAPMKDIQPYHWFKDHDVVYWRSGWDKDATGIAFKCGPPEGHAATKLSATLPDWHFEQGHAHPDVNSFILWAHGAYLAGDSGYAGVPKTVEHNTILVDGHGQGSELDGHDAWAKYPYERVNLALITMARLTKEGFEIQGDGAGAYSESLGLTKFVRTLRLDGRNRLTVTDELQTAKPLRFTEVLHSDQNITAGADGGFVLHGFGGAAQLILAHPELVTARVEKNIVMGPGIPGSVDKGQLEERGLRLELTDKEPAKSREFVLTLSF